MHLLSNSKHLQTNTRHPVREFNTPQIQKVMDYTKNVSENIFSPGCTQQDFRTCIPATVRKEDRKRQRNKSAQVKMHTYRGTNSLYFAYDPFTAEQSKRASSKIERITKIRAEIELQATMRQKCEVELLKVK